MEPKGSLVCSPQDPILSQMKPADISEPYFCNIPINP